MGKTTRNAISNDQKREISQYKRNNQKCRTYLLLLPNVKEALYMLVGAWNDVSKSTIVNCWNHANIIETKDTEEIVNKIIQKMRRVLLYMIKKERQRLKL